MLLEAMCLALVMHHEAGNQTIEGKIAVAHVVMERVKDRRWRKTVCGVVFQEKQFSHVEESVKDEKHWRKYIPLAEAVLAGLTINPVPGANHFHADYVSPSWSKEMVKVEKIGAHIFYSDNPQAEPFWETADPVPTPPPDTFGPMADGPILHGAAEVG